MSRGKGVANSGSCFGFGERGAGGAINLVLDHERVEKRLTQVKDFLRRHATFDESSTRL